MYCNSINFDCKGSNSQFASYEICYAACVLPTWSCGTPTDTSGNTIWCRINHVYAAEDHPSTAAVECPLGGPTSTGCL
jgi:hypothetical protein